LISSTWARSLFSSKWTLIKKSRCDERTYAPESLSVYLALRPTISEPDEVPVDESSCDSIDGSALGSCRSTPAWHCVPHLHVQPQLLVRPPEWSVMSTVSTHPTY
jgi:hypothetical protein